MAGSAEPTLVRPVETQLQPSRAAVSGVSMPAGRSHR